MKISILLPYKENFLNYINFPLHSIHSLTVDCFLLNLLIPSFNFSYQYYPYFTLQQIKLYTKYKTIRWSHRLRVRTGGFQSPNRGSNPRGTANFQLNYALIFMRYYVYLIGPIV